MDRQYWIAVLGDGDLAYLRRHGMRELAIAATEIEPRPAVGDRLAVLHRRCFVVTGTVTKLLGEHPFRLRIRRKVCAPRGAHLPFAWFAPALACAIGWTDERLDDLVESFLPIGASDLARVEIALLALALRCGPAPKRPSHRRPRSPGRRRLVAALATAFQRPR